MPNDNTTEITLADPLTISAADAYKALGETPSPDAETDKEGNTETEETTEEVPAADEGETETEAEPDEDEDLSLPELDARAKEAIGDNPKAVAEWDRAWKGVIKREKQLSEKQEAFKTESTGYDTFQQMEANLSDPAKAAQTLEVLVNHLKEKGVDLPWYQPVGETVTLSKRTPIAGDKPWHKAGFESEGEMFAAQQAESAQKQVIQLKQQLEAFQKAQPDQNALRELLNQNETAKKAKEHDDYISGVTPRIAAKAKSTLGWEGVTKADVGKAAMMFPELIKTDAMLALKQAHPDKYAEVVSKASTRKKAPDLIDSTEAGGVDIPKDPEKITAHHAYQLISQS